MTAMEPSQRDPQLEASPPTNGEGSPAPAKEVPTAKARRKLPGWLDHFNARDLKVLFRCSIAAWIAAILIFITPSLSVIGTATFFAT